MNKALLPPQFADAQVSPASCWPGFDLLQIFEHPPVVSCEDAAAARGVPLSVELKTLVVRAKDMFFAVHLPGDKRLNSRAVKKALGTRRIRFASADELADVGLRAGLVNPGNTIFCAGQLVCASVLSKPFVTTNAGTFVRGVAFAPQDLLTMPNTTSGEFSHG
jgi:prolyl-tRNA editing enzyme YbaK/EbsC (Cys-tRNA(Pro) deacylase)